MSFKGKNAVITGGAGGIGLQVCVQLLKNGIANVALIDVQENLERIAKLRAAHPSQTIILIKMDVANKPGIEAAFEEIVKNFGSIDLVVNVAGIFNDLDVTRTLQVNLGGMINSTLAGMKHMSKENGGPGGLIANMSSVVGLDPMFLLPVYSSTKHAIIGFTRCLGNDYYYQKTGIKFITVCPGATITDMFTNFTEKILFSDMADESYVILDRLNKQSAADVSRCMIEAFEKDENGKVYIIEGKKLFPVEMTRYWSGIENQL